MAAARILVTASDGNEWRYEEGSTRIYCDQTGDEINVWSHAAGWPAIAFTAKSVLDRVEQWLRDDDPESPSPEPPDAPRATDSDQIEVTLEANPNPYRNALMEIAAMLPHRNMWDSAADFMENTCQIIDNTPGITRPAYYPGRENDHE